MSGDNSLSFVTHVIVVRKRFHLNQKCLVLLSNITVFTITFLSILTAVLIFPWVSCSLKGCQHLTGINDCLLNLLRILFVEWFKHSSQLSSIAFLHFVQWTFFHSSLGWDSWTWSIHRFPSNCLERSPGFKQKTETDFDECSLRYQPLYWVLWKVSCHSW